MVITYCGILPQVLPFYSCSLGEEEETEAASAQAQPPSEALAQVIPVYLTTVIIVGYDSMLFVKGDARVLIFGEFLEEIQ